MKICKTCGVAKPLKQYRRDSRLTDGYQSSCKTCVSQRIKAAYKNKYAEKTKMRSADYRLRNRQFVVEFLRDKECEHCGIKDPVVFEFHHTDPSEKEHTVSLLVTRGTSLGAIKKEIEKCIILCANCHRKVHKEDFWK